MKTFNTLPENVQAYLTENKTFLVSEYNGIVNTKTTLKTFMTELVDLCHYIDEDENVSDAVEECLESLEKRFSNDALAHLDTTAFHEQRLQERRNLHANR